MHFLGRTEQEQTKLALAVALTDLDRAREYLEELVRTRPEFRGIPKLVRAVGLLEEVEADFVDFYGEKVKL